MKRIILFFTVIFVSLLSGTPSYSQSDGCGTTIPPGVTQAPTLPAEPPACGPYTITVKAHIVRTSSGTGGLPLSQLNQAIQDANTRFAAAGLTFQLHASIDYINSDAFYYDINTNDELDQLRQTNVVANCINAYFTQNLADDGGGLCGKSSFTFSPVQGIVMRNSCTGTASNPSAFAHELGHIFDLFHTHEIAFGIEWVDGSNCSSAGDLLCDTPADPNLYGQVNTACQYTGSQLDPPPHNDPYDPDETLVMSYSRFECMTNFTSQSNQRMLCTLVTWRTDLLPPPSVTIASPAGTPSWYIGTPQTISWSVCGNSSNIQQWEVLVQGEDENCAYQTFYSTTLSASARTYQWTVQQSPFFPGLCVPPNAKVVVNAKDAAGAVLASASGFMNIESLVQITNPTWGWTYLENSLLNIYWIVAPGYSISSQALYQSYDGGTTWYPIVEGLASGARQYQWTATPNYRYGFSKMKLVVTGSGFPGGSATWITDWILGQSILHHGAIAYNTRWSGSYRVDGDITIQAGATVTVTAGADVRMDAGDFQHSGTDHNRTEINVLGSLVTQGTTSAHVFFRSNVQPPAEGNWLRIAATGGGSATLNYAEIRHADTGLYASTSGDITVTNATFDGNTTTDLNVVAAHSCIITGNTITVASGQGIQIGTAATINNNVITGTSVSLVGVTTTSEPANYTMDGNSISGFLNGSGIWLAYGNTTVTNCTIWDCSDGIQVTRGTNTLGVSPTNGNEIYQCNRGIDVLCLTGGGNCPGCPVSVTVRSSNIHSNAYGVFATKTAAINLGQTGSKGNNIIAFNASYCVYNNASTCGTINAVGNYFGSCAPPTCTFGSVNTANYLCNPPSLATYEMPIAEAPARTSLVGIHPNPFNPTTTIDFELTESAWTTISIYNVSGQLVRVESLGSKPAGKHNWVWKGTDQRGNSVSSGVYFVVLKAGTVTDRMKAVLLK